MFKCPICKNNLTLEVNKIKYEDYICRSDVDSHMYIHRVREDQILQLKVRITDPDGSKMYVKIYYDQDKSEVWTRSNDNERIKIEHAFDLDFSDMEKFKQKIKTYMMFS